MRRLSLQAIRLFIVMTVVVFRWQSASTVAQDKEDAQPSFATSLDRDFSSDDLEWLPEQNRMLIKGKVNDALAVFKIDTGAFGTLLTLKSAKDRSLRVIDLGAQEASRKGAKPAKDFGLTFASFAPLREANDRRG